MNALNPAPDAYAVNLSVLETAHAIFGRWRSEMRSNELFTVIDFVLGCSRSRFFKFSLHSWNAPRQPAPAKKYAETVAQAMAVIVHVSYDLVRRDLPPALEDIRSGFLGAESGMFSYGALQTSRQQVFFHE